MSTSRLIPSAKVVCYVNGRSFARVMSFHWDSATPKKAIMGIDSGEPFELAPTTNKLTGSMMMLRTLGDGGLEGAGVAAQYVDVPREKYFTIAIVELTTDTVLFQASRCSVLSQSWDIPNKGIVTGSMSFEAIDWNNEVERKSQS